MNDDIPTFGEAEPLTEEDKASIAQTREKLGLSPDLVDPDIDPDTALPYGVDEDES